MTDHTDKIYSEDADMAHYFIEQKGDVTRWCDWEQKREALCAAVPEIDDWVRAQRIARALERTVLERLKSLRDALGDRND